jgi:hypothetical protein
MSFASWKNKITIEKHAISKMNVASGATSRAFVADLDGTFFVSFCPMIRASDPIISVTCKMGSQLGLLGENLVAEFFTEPSDYRNMDYEQINLSGVYVSDGYPFQITLNVVTDTGSVYSYVAQNANSTNLSIMKLR